MYRRIIKPTADFMVATLFFVVFLPVFILLVILLWIHYRGNPFFLQQRVGRNEKPFFIFKFKSMKDLYDDEGVRLPDHLRVTTLGKWIRKSSLDELPQLINVIRGNMSFIGPRPLPVSFVPYYTERERKRHDAKPGITGLAQVSGRNRLPWDERLELDVKYVENISAEMDVKILLNTIQKVIKQEDITLTPQIDSLIVLRGGEKPVIKKRE